MPGWRRWFDRKFALGLPQEAFPDILERVRGTPARLEERTRLLSRETLVHRIGGAWSIQQNAGHLLDLEPLWSGRLDELLQGAAELRPADLENRKTHEEDHNDRSMEELLREFRPTRMTIVERLEALSDDEVQISALHPRLRQPMTAVDLFFFVAEHDDHHLACITRILAEINA